MTTSLQHLCAAAAMHARLEKIVVMGILPEDLELDTRLLIQRAGKAFALDSVAERPANNNADMDAQISAVVIEMARAR